VAGTPGRGALLSCPCPGPSQRLSGSPPTPWLIALDTAPALPPVSEAGSTVWPDPLLMASATACREEARSGRKQAVRPRHTGPQVCHARTVAICISGLHLHCAHKQPVQRLYTALASRGCPAPKRRLPGLWPGQLPQPALRRLQRRQQWRLLQPRRPSPQMRLPARQQARGMESGKVGLSMDSSQGGKARIARLSSHEGRAGQP
jgi:hypothetical protein